MPPVRSTTLLFRILLLCLVMVPATFAQYVGWYIYSMRLFKIIELIHTHDFLCVPHFLRALSHHHQHTPLSVSPIRRRMHCEAHWRSRRLPADQPMPVRHPRPSATQGHAHRLRLRRIAANRVLPRDRPADDNDDHPITDRWSDWRANQCAKYVLSEFDEFSYSSDGSDIIFCLNESF